MFLCDFCRFFDPPVSFGVTEKITVPSAASTVLQGPLWEALEATSLKQIGDPQSQDKAAPPLSLSNLPNFRDSLPRSEDLPAK